MIGDATLTRLVRGKEIVLNARRQGGDWPRQRDRGDAPHSARRHCALTAKSAVLTATGTARANSPPSLPSAQRPNSAVASAPCAASISTASAARKSLPWSRRSGIWPTHGSARPPIIEGRPSPCLFNGMLSLKEQFPARGAPYIGLPIPPFERRTWARLRDAARAPRPGRYARSRNRTGSVPARSRHTSRNQ